MMRTILLLTFVFISSVCSAENVRAVYREDGGVSIIYGKDFDTVMKDIGLNSPYEDLDIKDLPDREFRNAWTGEKGKGVWVDEAKKKELIAKRDKKDPDPTATAAAAGAAAGAAAAAGVGALKKKKNV